MAGFIVPRQKLDHGRYLAAIFRVIILDPSIGLLLNQPNPLHDSPGSPLGCFSIFLSFFWVLFVSRVSFGLAGPL